MQLQFKRNTMEIGLQKGNLEFLFYELLLLFGTLLVVTFAIGTHSVYFCKLTCCITLVQPLKYSQIKSSKQHLLSNNGHTTKVNSKLNQAPLLKTFTNNRGQQFKAKKQFNLELDNNKGSNYMTHLERVLNEYDNQTNKALNKRWHTN